MASILHVAQPTSGGVARAVLGMAESQHADGVDVAVACPPGPLADRLTSAGLSWERWNSERKPGPRITDERRALRAILARRAPDLVHLHSSKAGLVGRLTVRGRLRTVFQPHAWSFLAAEGAERLGALGWERYATRWTHLTLFCSRQEHADGVSQGIRGRGRVVLNGVDLHRFTPADDAGRVRSRRELGLPADARVAAIVGRRSYQKGQDLAIAAWPAVRRAVPSAVLLLVGEGYDDAFDTGRGVLSLAARDDVRPVFAATDLVLSPSRWEGLSLALLEGMASGRAAVATDVAGSREVLIDGVLPAAGAVVPAGDTAALTTAVTERLRDAVRTTGEGRAGRLRVEERHHERATIGAVQDAYRLLLEPSQ